ncbi:MAG: GNAT family N-acetyltransferase [Saprospiraceae bacterium]|nr:GNAT family N-acetyltransferase [Lewinella sp.]
MQQIITLDDIHIRTELRSGDLTYVAYRHARIYKEECDYGIPFESYVCAGLHEFYQQYNPDKDRVWVCEHQDRIIGFLLLMHRAENAAQFRYFYLEPEYRGLGLGKRLMQYFMEALRVGQYESAYLWTTDEQITAIALYERFGFRKTDEKASDSFGRRVLEQRFELVINGL